MEQPLQIKCPICSAPTVAFRWWKRGIEENREVRCTNWHIVTDIVPFEAGVDVED